MEECRLSVGYQARYLGANARRLYSIKPPEYIIAERVTEIQRTEWWPTEEEIKETPKPKASVTR